MLPHKKCTSDEGPRSFFFFFFFCEEMENELKIFQNLRPQNAMLWSLCLLLHEAVLHGFVNDPQCKSVYPL